MNIERMKKKILSMHGEVSFPHLPQEEYETRLKKAKELMTSHGIDALVLFSPENLFYYTGFKPTAHFMIYAFFLTLGLFSIVAKRLAQKMARFKDTEIK